MTYRHFEWKVDVRIVSLLLIACLIPNPVLAEQPPFFLTRPVALLQPPLPAFRVEALPVEPAFSGSQEQLPLSRPMALARRFLFPALAMSRSTTAALVHRYRELIANLCLNLFFETESWMPWILLAITVVQPDEEPTDNEFALLRRTLEVQVKTLKGRLQNLSKGAWLKLWHEPAITEPVLRSQWKSILDPVSSQDVSHVARLISAFRDALPSQRKIRLKRGGKRHHETEAKVLREEARALYDKFSQADNLMSQFLFDFLHAPIPDTRHLDRSVVQAINWADELVRWAGQHGWEASGLEPSEIARARMASRSMLTPIDHLHVRRALRRVLKIVIPPGASAAHDRWHAKLDGHTSALNLQSLVFFPIQTATVYRAQNRWTNAHKTLVWKQFLQHWTDLSDHEGIAFPYREQRKEEDTWRVLLRPQPTPARLMAQFAHAASGPILEAEYAGFGAGLEKEGEEDWLTQGLYMLLLDWEGGLPQASEPNEEYGVTWLLPLFTFLFNRGQQLVETHGWDQMADQVEWSLKHLPEQIGNVPIRSDLSSMVVVRPYLIGSLLAGIGLGLAQQQLRLSGNGENRHAAHFLAGDYVLQAVLGGREHDLRKAIDRANQSIQQPDAMARALESARDEPASPNTLFGLVDGFAFIGLAFDGLSGQTSTLSTLGAQAALAALPLLMGSAVALRRFDFAGSKNNPLRRPHALKLLRRHA